jgi:hypothetical protein
LRDVPTLIEEDDASVTRGDGSSREGRDSYLPSF